MAKYINDSRSSVAAKEEKGVEVVVHEDHSTLDPEAPPAAGDVSVGVYDDHVQFSANDDTRENSSTMKKRIFGAVTLLFAITSLIAALIKQPTDNTSIAAPTRAEIPTFAHKSAAVRRTKAKKSNRAAFSFSMPAAVMPLEINSAIFAVAAECCVNTATGVCHTDDKCNKKERECLKCDKKADDETYIWQTGDPRAPTEEPCCVNIQTNMCHADKKCNKKEKDCAKDKCQVDGASEWKVRSSQTPAPTPPIPPTTPTPTSSTPAPNDDPTVYEYTDTKIKCDIGGGNNVQGPAPLPDKRNVVVDFWAFGDSPYDQMAKTCLSGDCNVCAVSNENIDQLPFPNTCTFEGAEYNCIKHSIMPFMNRKMEGGDGAFQVHLGDILKGTSSAANSRRCTDASFSSRAKLFEPATNFLLINGDNESNECMGYDIEKPSDPVRSMWREKFGRYSFTNDFPAITGGGRPTVTRLLGNEEIFGFEHKNVAFFGLDYPAGKTYITKNAPEDLNAKFVRETLATDLDCDLKSIVLFSHVAPASKVDKELGNYFKRCGEKPTLTVLGNAHPKTYCMTEKNDRITLTVEAFRSGPLMVSVLRDAKEGGKDYFHVADSDLSNSNKKCPNFS